VCLHGVAAGGPKCCAPALLRFRQRRAAAPLKNGSHWTGLLHRRMQEDALHVTCRVYVIQHLVSLDFTLHLTSQWSKCMAWHLSVRSSPSCRPCKHKRNSGAHSRFGGLCMRQGRTQSAVPCHGLPARSSAHADGEYRVLHLWRIISQLWLLCNTRQAPEARVLSCPAILGPFQPGCRAVRCCGRPAPAAPATAPTRGRAHRSA